MYTILASIVGMAAVGIGFGNYYLKRVPDMPKPDLERWWADSQKPDQEDESIRPFKIEFNDSMIVDLKNRLRHRRLYTPPLDGMQSKYGMNTIYLEKILKYWLKKYNFKERAERLNQFPHFKTKVQGLDIQFIKVKPEVKDKKILPLLMMHGWPSSSKEFDKVIPMLTTPKDEYDFVFEVVAVDLPGFGFSEGTNKPGLNPAQIGIIMRNLMRRLGFRKFFIQAGDWGSQVGSHMATLFPNDILGFHTNMPVSSRPISVVKYVIGSLFPSLIMESKFKERLYPIKDYLMYFVREGGYFHLHATKPDTIGAALTDTPAGMAAYALEKIGVCCHRNQLDTLHGGLDNLEIDDLLDTMTIMWANEQITYSIRIYAEAFAWPEVFVLHNIPTKVPTAAINFAHEVMYQPDWILRDKFPNLVHSSTLDFGGHFAALQTPEALVDDIFEGVSEINKFNAKNQRT